MNANYSDYLGCSRFLQDVKLFDNRFIYLYNYMCVG